MRHSIFLTVGWMAFAHAGAMAAQLPGTGAPSADVPIPSERALRDPIELCEKLAGVEREICVKKARENREGALTPGIGSSPGQASEGASGARPEKPSR